MIKYLKHLLAFFGAMFRQPSETNISGLSKKESFIAQHEYSKAVRRHNLKVTMMEQWCKVFNYDPFKAEESERNLKARRRATGRYWIRHTMA